MKFKKRGRLFHAERGQSNADAASVLIGIITLILIFYIVFLPPEERDLILGDNETQTNTGSIVAEKGELLRESGLILSFLAETKEQEITIPNFALTESRPDKLILSHPGFIVSKGFFKDKPKELKFSITDLKNLDKLFLTFTTPKHEGAIKITINANELFEGTITTEQPQTIEVSKDLLKQDNTLIINAVSGKYEFKEFNIISRTTEPQKLTALNNFNLESNVYDSIKEGKFSYYLSCDQMASDMVDIILNNNKLFSATPVCDSPNMLKLSKTDFVPGKNVLLIKAEKGEYSFDQAKIKLELSEAKDLVRYFEANQTVYDQIISNNKKVILKMNFVSEKEFKEAEISINGRLTRLDQKEREYKKDITSMIQQGTNFIQVTPKSRLEIVDLVIKVENA